MSFDIAPYLSSYLSSFDRLKSKTEYKERTILPKMSDIKAVEEGLLELFFPGARQYSQEASLKESVELTYNIVANQLENLIYLGYEATGHPNAEQEANQVMQEFCTQLPQIRRILKTDVQACFNGDPAAKSQTEIIVCYPCIRVLAVHRVAHLLFTLGVPLIPRMLSELSHSETGIDIHPGATIGESFFMDHGTGTVIGETTIIGSNVKIYQGVTLGALSFPKAEDGSFIRNQKRHPTIQDRVTIYSNATILGDVTIGNDSIIGSSVWIKSDVPAFSTVVYKNPEITSKRR